MNKAVFFDRDGVIIKMFYDLENGLIESVKTPSQIELVYGIVDLLKHTAPLGYKNIIISNQPDIGLKKVNEKNFNLINKSLIEKLNAEGASIDSQYYCLHHTFALVEKYKKNCDCRKPKPGLFFQAAKEHNIDLAKSWMIGDGLNDIIAGHKAGCRTILLANIAESEYLRILEEKLNGLKPDFLVKKLNEVNEIINNNI